jgi:hypothetical protein
MVHLFAACPYKLGVYGLPIILFEKKLQDPVLLHGSLLKTENSS